jgi:ligand-binding sensor domain-containing protein
MYGHNIFWANSADITYDYQGFTDDERYYVFVTLPIDAPILLSTSSPEENTNEGAIPVPAPLPDDFAQLNAAIQEYNQEVKQQLDLLAAADFTPSLDVLDALVTSLRIEAPTATPSIDSQLRLVSLIPPILPSEITGLRTDPDGTLWVFTTYGYGLWREGQWTMQHSDRSEIMVGVDDAERMWFFVNEDGSKIYTRDSGSEYKLADTGWLPVLDPVGLGGRGVHTDADGRVWLATDQDVRAFDSAEWTVFSRKDMDMIPPSDADISTLFTLELVGQPGQIWIGECDWGGLGPVGGSGARWFDGQVWEGADSPAASGCVTAIQGDSLGRVWLGVDADLWRYDPATGDWTRFAPPQPPEGYHFCNITDIALDPAGNPWPVFPLCGGASCTGKALHYRLQDGAWVQIGDISHYTNQILLFDGAGTPWLLGGGVYRIEANQPVEPPVAPLAVQAAGVDTEGRVWLAGWQAGIIGVQPATDLALWVLKPQGTNID